MGHSAENDSISESICREALELYKGKSMSQLFAHDLQVYLIRQGRPDTMLLRPFLEKHHWPEVDVAHAVALLKTGHYQSAVNLMHNIPDTKNYQRNKRIQFMKSICGVLLATDKKDPVFDEVAKSSDVNKVAILLYADKNEEAYEEAMRMPDSLAMTHYFRATCLNRLDSKVDDSKSLAKKALKKALEMDPALMQVVERDADVNKLLFDDDEDGKKLFASKKIKVFCEIFYSLWFWAGQGNNLQCILAHNPAAARDEGDQLCGQGAADEGADRYERD